MRWNLILLAAGYSRRFGDRKLLAEINGTPLYRFSLDKIRKLSEKLGDTTILVVTSYPEIEAYCRKQSVTVIKNDGTDNTGIASSIQKAVKYLETQECALEGSRKADVFFTADQPGLDENEVWMFLNQYASQNKKIGTMECKNIWRSPNVFDACYRSKLLQLSADKGGKAVMKQHAEDVFCFHTEKETQFLILIRERIYCAYQISFFHKLIYE